MLASDLFIKCLENEGVEYIFGMAGEENLHLLEAIRKSSIKYIPIRHEQAAGFMAANYGRLTGKAGVVLTTLGPGATNLTTPAAYAKLGAFPMIMITGQKPVKHNPQGNFQIIDIPTLMKPVTKYSTSIYIANRIPAEIREAFRLAEEERPGPVHIELPKDIALEDVENAHIFPKDMVRRPIAEYRAITQAVEMIKSAKSPLLLIGAGGNRKRTSKMLTEFIDKTGIPFVNTQMGKGVVDERHEKFIGTCALSANDYVHKAIEESDLIINVGHDIIEKSPFLMKPDSKFKVIHINYFGAQVHNFYFPQLEVIGDIANAIWQIKENLEPQKTWDFSYALKIKQVIEEKIYTQYKNLTDKNIGGFPAIKPQEIVNTIRDILPEDGILALDNGMYKLWFARYFKAYTQNQILLDNALATMGAGLPSGISTKILNSDKKVVVITGDGGFMMNSQEIETAIRLNLDLVIVLINDSGLGMIKWEQDEKHYDSFGLDHKNPDFIKYIESYGGKGVSVNLTEDLSNEFKRALDSKGVNLIEVIVDYSENQKVFVEEIHTIKDLTF